MQPIASVPKSVACVSGRNAFFAMSLVARALPKPALGVAAVAVASVRANTSTANEQAMRMSVEPPRGQTLEAAGSLRRPQDERHRRGPGRGDGDRTLGAPERLVPQRQG